MGKLLPIILALVGLGAGVGAGIALRPAPSSEPEMANPCGDVSADTAEHAAAEKAADEAAHDYVKLNNQFIVPVVDDGKVSSLVVLAISLEVQVGQTEEIYQREPKLRDVFLQVMFDHANSGGFNGAFTNTVPMTVLRDGLLEAARRTLGPIVSDVLIMDIVRQDA